MLLLIDAVYTVVDLNCCIIDAKVIQFEIEGFNMIAELDTVLILNQFY